MVRVTVLYLWLNSKINFLVLSINDMSTSLISDLTAIALVCSLFADVDGGIITHMCEKEQHHSENK